jgi:hypothetical protein
MSKRFKLFLLTICLVSVFANAQVQLPCGGPKKPCPPVDPCKMNPDRCKDKGGPIVKKNQQESATKGKKAQQKSKTKTQKKSDNKQ